MASVAKDFHRLMKRVGKLTDGQVTISDIDWDEGTLRCFHIILRPNSGLYKNGKFKFEIRLSDDYLETPPTVWCHTDIYHPNIDPTEECYSESSTNVCLNLLENGIWNKSYGLEGTVLGLLFLMHNPNLQDPLSPYFEGCDDEESFKDNVRKYMAGEEIDDNTFNTGFCVRDGVLIEDVKPASETDKKDLPNSFTDEHEQKTGENDSGTGTGDADNAETTETCILVDSLKDAETDVTNKDDELNVLKNVQTVACDENTAGTSGLVIDNVQNVSELNDLVNNDYDNEMNDCCKSDEDNDIEVELVNIDGECILLVHNSGNADINETEERNAEEEPKTATQEHVDTNQTNLNSMSTGDNAEVNSETDNLCNTSDSKENINATDEESKINLIPHASQSQSQTAEKNEDNDSCNISSQSNCHCDPWSTVRAAFRKIIHTIVQHNLYRDIGI